MNTAVQLYDGQLSLITTPIPKVSNPSDIVIKVSHCGVCGTDLHIVAGEFPAAKKLIMGHEFAGVVSEIGSAVHHVKVGDRVCVNPYDFCGTCHYCTRGHPQFCIKEAMRTAYGYQRNGGFQQYCLVPAHLVHPLPPTMTLQQAVFCQPLSTIVRGWDNMGKIESDANILVAGAGIIGLLWASMFHFHGYRTVTLSEPSPHRKEMATRLNLGYAVLHPQEIGVAADEARKRGDETWGYDVIVECTGVPRAVEAEFGWLRKGATLVQFGCCPKGKRVNFEPYDIFAKEVRIVSSFLNKFTFPRTIKLVHDMSERYLDWKKLDVGTYQLHDYAAALDTLRKGEISKAVFEL